MQQAAGARIPGDLTWRGEHESARRSNNRLSAPVSARSLLPKTFQPGLLYFVTQKMHAHGVRPRKDRRGVESDFRCAIVRWFRTPSHRSS